MNGRLIFDVVRSYGGFLVEELALVDEANDFVVREFLAEVRPLKERNSIVRFHPQLNLPLIDESHKNINKILIGGGLLTPQLVIHTITGSDDLISHTSSSGV